MEVDRNDNAYGEYVNVNLNQYGLGPGTDVYGLSPTTLQAPFDTQQPLDLSQSWVTQFSQQCSQTTVAYSLNAQNGSYDRSSFFLHQGPAVFPADPAVMPLDNTDESMAWLPSGTQPSEKHLNDVMVHLDLEARFQQAWDHSPPISSQDSSTILTPSSSFEELPASSQESVIMPLLSSPMSNEISPTHAETSVSGSTIYCAPASHWRPCPDVQSNFTLAAPHSAAKLGLALSNEADTSQSNMSIRACSPEIERGVFKVWGASLGLRDPPQPKAKPSSDIQLPKSRAKQKISKAKTNGQVKKLPAAVFRCHMEPCVSNSSKGGKFRREEHLKRHILSVHGDTWHYCRYCGKGFRGRSDNRDAHEERHFRNTGRTKFVNPVARKARC
ncbi:MAG: hypothetical protein M1816_001710 [Peltula sp. TS41687]|nr:MAG: hypothetical protein M1816_001710 [Peltula sp. TS41687]